MESVECVVVGAGVVGLAIARALSEAGHEVLVLERESTFGTQTSSRNSEVIHAGIYYEPGSLMARLCVHGRKALYAYCEGRNIPYRRCEKLIMATSENEVRHLAEIEQRACSNGVEDLAFLTKEKAIALEPALACEGALLSPSTGIIDSHAYMLSLLSDAEASGVVFVPKAPLLGAKPTPVGLELDVGGVDPGRGRTKTGYFWAIARDDRPWRGPEPPGVAYTYAPGRGAVHALKLLDNYTGVVQCDGYAAYKTLTNPERKNSRGEDITLAFCWSHLRRRFVEVERTSPAPAAKEALSRVGQLYTIERALRGRTAEERRQGRQAHAKPLVTALKAWFEERLKTLSAKSPTAEAIRYALNHWDGLARYLDDGRIELDTNAVERAMRPIALNRKNALFAGCDEGAEAWACIASLIESCRLNGVDPEAYLADVLGTTTPAAASKSPIDEVISAPVLIAVEAIFAPSERIF